MPSPSKRPARRLLLRDGRVVRFPAVMGIVNVTPDSFSDGGRYLDPARAVAHALELQTAGAAIIDIGGESTRPGAAAVAVEVELQRVIPVIRALRGKLRVPLSIDTRKAAVAKAALAAGAAIVNDVSGLVYDSEMAAETARAGAAIILMHMRGTPDVMMRHARYRDVVGEVCAFLRRQARVALRAGIRPSRIIVDPGLGFAKTARHNLEILGGLRRICTLGYPVLIGASRKRFVRSVCGDGDSDIGFGTVAANALAVAAGAAIIRVHEPAPALAAIKMASAITAAQARS